MKSATLIASLSAILAFGIQAATATCYERGIDWPDKSQALTFVREACNKADGAFSGLFVPLQNKSLCQRSGSASIGVLFEVQNLNTVGAYDLDDSECVMRLGNEVNGCEHGGESRIAGWRFRADTGEC